MNNLSIGLRGGKTKYMLEKLKEAWENDETTMLVSNNFIKLPSRSVFPVLQNYDFPTQELSLEVWEYIKEKL